MHLFSILKGILLSCCIKIGMETSGVLFSIPLNLIWCIETCYIESSTNSAQLITRVVYIFTARRSYTQLLWDFPSKYPVRKVYNTNFLSLQVNGFTCVFLIDTNSTSFPYNFVFFCLLWYKNQSVRKNPTICAFIIIGSENVHGSYMTVAFQWWWW